MGMEAIIDIHHMATKGGSKGQGKGKKENPSMPSELQKKWFKTSKVEPLRHCALDSSVQVAARTRWLQEKSVLMAGTFALSRSARKHTAYNNIQLDGVKHPLA